MTCIKNLFRPTYNLGDPVVLNHIIYPNPGLNELLMTDIKIDWRGRREILHGRIIDISSMGESENMITAIYKEKPLNESIGVSNKSQELRKAHFWEKRSPEMFPSLDDIVKNYQMGLQYQFDLRKGKTLEDFKANLNNSPVTLP